MNYCVTVYVDGIYGNDSGSLHPAIPFRTITSALKLLETITKNSSQRALLIIRAGRYSEKCLNFINVDVKAEGEVFIDLCCMGDYSGSNIMEDSGVVFYQA
jgi:hypothetical protein